MPEMKLFDKLKAQIKKKPASEKDSQEGGEQPKKDLSDLIPDKTQFTSPPVQPVQPEVQQPKSIIDTGVPPESSPAKDLDDFLTKKKETVPTPKPTEQPIQPQSVSQPHKSLQQPEPQSKSQPVQQPQPPQPVPKPQEKKGLFGFLSKKKTDKKQVSKSATVGDAFETESKPFSLRDDLSNPVIEKTKPATEGSAATERSTHEGEGATKGNTREGAGEKKSKSAKTADLLEAISDAKKPSEGKLAQKEETLMPELDSLTKNKPIKHGEEKHSNIKEFLTKSKKEKEDPYEEKKETDATVAHELFDGKVEKVEFRKGESNAMNLIIVASILVSAVIVIIAWFLFFGG